jgi:hypothetical protein
VSENVFDQVQIGLQAGTLSAPGSAVAATFLYPVSEQIAIELDRASEFSQRDRGRNVRNAAGAGYHGLRGANVTLPSEARYEDIIALLQTIYAGGVVPTGTNPYTWVFPFEAVAPTVKPMTLEVGNNDASQAQARLKSAFVSSLTLGFASLSAPGVSPWTISAEAMGLDREINALTGALSEIATAPETIMGHLTRLYEGTTATAFASLTELAGSLKSFTMTADRHLVRRAYGSSSDLATGFGFSEPSNATFEALVAISATAKSDFHDIWNSSGGSLGERRWRLKAIGSGTKTFTIDARVGILAVPFDEVDGERLYKVTGEFVDDSTLSASHTITVVNAVSAIP